MQSVAVEGCNELSESCLEGWEESSIFFLHGKKQQNRRAAYGADTLRVVSG